jgi:hypothetical protein
MKHAFPWRHSRLCVETACPATRSMIGDAAGMPKHSAFGTSRGLLCEQPGHMGRKYRMDGSHPLD